MSQPLTQQRLMFDYVEDYRKYLQARAQESEHMCGLQGFNPMLGDNCPKCEAQFLDRIAVDPDKIKMYAPNHRIGEARSKTMEEDVMGCEICGAEDHWEDDCDERLDGFDCEEYNIRDFIGRLETFLEGELDTITRGNVFLAKNGEGVSVNILVGAPFDNTEETINQINLIIAPTDRSVLGVEGLTVHDMETVEDETGDEDYSSPFDEAMQILD